MHNGRIGGLAPALDHYAPELRYRYPDERKAARNCSSFSALVVESGLASSLPRPRIPSANRLIYLP